MTLPREEQYSVSGSAELLALIEQAREMTLTALDSLQGGDISAVEESVRRRGSLLDQAADQCLRLSSEATMSATQVDYRGHVRCTALSLKECDEGLRSALQVEKKKVSEQLQNLGRKRQILQYAQSAERGKSNP